MGIKLTKATQAGVGGNGRSHDSSCSQHADDPFVPALPFDALTAIAMSAFEESRRMKSMLSVVGKTTDAIAHIMQRCHISGINQLFTWDNLELL